MELEHTHTHTHAEVQRCSVLSFPTVTTVNLVMAMSGESWPRSHFLLNQHKAASSLRSIQRLDQDHSCCFKKERRSLGRLPSFQSQFDERRNPGSSRMFRGCVQSDRCVLEVIVRLLHNLFSCQSTVS